MPWTHSPETRATDARRYGAEYKRKRAAAMRRANWRCEIRIEGVCIGAASQCDHTLQAENDPHHDQLRAACKPCHAYVTAHQGLAARAESAGSSVPYDPVPRPTTNWTA